MLGRLSIDATGDLLVSPIDDEWGGGAMVTANLEVAGFVEGTFAESGSNGAAAGAAMGELGVALQASGGLHAVGPEHYWLATIGLGVRLPAMVGAGIASPR